MAKPGQEASYRLQINLTSVVGVTIEISNPAGSGKIVKLRYYILYNLAAADMTWKRNTTGATAGTSAGLTPTKNNSQNPLPVTTAKTFSVAPGAGTLDSIQLLETRSGAAVFNPINSNPESLNQYLELNPGEFMAIEFTTAVGIKGWVEFSEVSP